MSSIPELFEQQVRARPNAVALRHHELGRWKPYTWLELSRLVDQAKKALSAIGVRAGTRVAVAMQNSTEWIVLDLAALSLGAITIPLDPDLSPRTMAGLIRFTEAEIVVAGDQEQHDKVASYAQDLHSLRALIVVVTRGMTELSDAKWTGLSQATHTNGPIEVAWAQLLAVTASDGVPISEACSPEQIATIEVQVGPGGTVQTRPRSHLELAHSFGELATGISLRPGDDLLAVVSQARPLERALTESGWLIHGSILNIGRGGNVRDLEITHVQPTVVHLSSQDLRRIADSAKERCNGTGIGPTFAQQVFSRPRPRSSSSLNDLRIFRALMIAAFVIGLWVNATFRSLVGWVRVLIFVGLLILALGIALQTGCAVRPFLRKAFGLNRTRQILTDEHLDPDTAATFASLGLPPVLAGSGADSTPFDKTALPEKSSHHEDSLRSKDAGVHVSEGVSS
jgi:AMP-binding enzyme